MSKPIYHMPQFQRLESFMHNVASIVEKAGNAEEVSKLERVPHESSPGFLPLTDGGLTKDFFFSLNEHVLRNRESFKYPAFPAAIEEHLVEIETGQYVSCVSAFVHDNVERFKSLPVNTLDEVNDALSMLSDEELDEYESHASEYGLETSRFRVRIGLTYRDLEQDQLYFFVSLNVDDPYFRDQGEFRRQTGGKRSVDFLLMSQEVSLSSIPLHGEFNLSELCRMHSMISSALSPSVASSELMPAILASLLDENSAGMYSVFQECRDSASRSIAKALLVLDPNAFEHLKDTRIFSCNIYTEDGDGVIRAVTYPQHIPFTKNATFIAKTRLLCLDASKIALDNAPENIPAAAKDATLNRLSMAFDNREVTLKRLRWNVQGSAELERLVQQPINFHQYISSVVETDIQSIKEALAPEPEAQSSPCI